jgi:trehalose 6-phosphate synthase/phosphatase
MPLKEQKERNAALQNRLQRYTVEKWATSFMKSLLAQKDLEAFHVSRKLTENQIEKLKETYTNSNKRLLFLDYDGTLTGFKNNPKDAKPDAELYALLDTLHASKNTELYLISGRDKETFSEWFLHKEYNMIVEHGLWMSKAGQPFELLENVKNDWMPKIRPVLESFVDRTPGSFIEEKNYSLAWHYRKADPDFGNLRATELNTVLTSLIGTDNLSILNGNKVTEVKSSNVNKGRAAVRILHQDPYDFIFAIGDDWTDEYMFQELPENSVTVKVGRQKTVAKYFVENIEGVRKILKSFSEV